MSKEENNQIITFGCRLNAFESEAIKQAVELSGQKNLIVFNSCAVTAKAEKDLRISIRKARKNNPHAKIIVTGCAAQIDPQKYASLGEVDLVLGNTEKSKLESYQNNFSATDNFLDKSQKIESPKIQNNSDFKSAIKIENKKLISINPKQDKDPQRNFKQDSRQNHLQNQWHNQRQDQDSQQNHHQDQHEDHDKDLKPNHHQDRLFYEELHKKDNALNDHQLSKIKVNDIMSVRDTAPQLVSYFENQTRAFLEIQNGCNHRCTFCIIPYGRGNSRSVGFGEIVSQCKKMIANGHQEIVLTGVDISDYGIDLPHPLTLAQMIKKLLKLVPDLQRLRLSSIDVSELDDEFLEVLASEPRLTPYLHLSAQSGDDLILKRMKRRHNRQQLLDFCTKARKLRPDITFGADLIAGFPTEDQQMFENSLSLIKEADLIFTHIFPYSPRLGTPASKMKQLDRKIIKDRTKILRDTGEKQLEKFLAKQVGKEFLVLVEKNNCGKTTNFLNVRIIPDSSNADIVQIRELSTNNLSQNIFRITENSLVQVKIVSSNEKELIANLI
jgi:threonylcarbamoyladenosine tRNA methylthiotransferase MtaB